VDIGVKGIKKYYYSDTPDQKIKDRFEQYGYDLEDLPNMVFKIDEESESFDPNTASENPIGDSQILQEYLEEEGLNSSEIPAYFYEVEFEKPGGLVMPLIVEYAYADGTKERITYPVQLWRKNDASVKKIIASDKELVSVTVDPDNETADVNADNNSWPRKESPSDFDKFKEKIKG
jgi:hypothetical protein